MTPTSRPASPGARPGLLPSQEIERLVASGVVATDRPVEEAQVQPASLDLRLGPVAWRVEASFLPGEGGSVAEKAAELRMHEPLDLTRPCLLERGCVYIVPLLERLALPPGLSARANPKSTTGRLDVFTRLIADGATRFDDVPDGYAGPLYVEVAPRTFSVVAREGLRLNQLRFRRGGPRATDRDLGTLHREEALVFRGGAPADAIISDGLWLTVDLEGIGGAAVVGWRARPAGAVDLSTVGAYDVLDFWEPVRRPRGRGLVLQPDQFYILASKEEVRVPPDHAAEMVAYEPPVGEFRVHYAGFFDPGFGDGPDIRGTRAVLEVRSHEVPFLLEDGQIVGRLVYERMAEVPHRLYGRGIGSSYQSQGLKLGKQFRTP